MLPDAMIDKPDKINRKQNKKQGSICLEKINGEWEIMISPNSSRQ